MFLSLVTWYSVPRRTSRAVCMSFSHVLSLVNFVRACAFNTPNRGHIWHIIFLYLSLSLFLSLPLCLADFLFLPPSPFSSLSDIQACGATCYLITPPSFLLPLFFLLSSPDTFGTGVTFGMDLRSDTGRVCETLGVIGGHLAFEAKRREVQASAKFGAVACFLQPFGKLWLSSPGLTSCR